MYATGRRCKPPLSRFSRRGVYSGSIPSNGSRRLVRVTGSGWSAGRSISKKSLRRQWAAPPGEPVLEVLDSVRDGRVQSRSARSIVASAAAQGPYRVHGAGAAHGVADYWVSGFHRSTRQGEWRWVVVGRHLRRRPLSSPSPSWRRASVRAERARRWCPAEKTPGLEGPRPRPPAISISMGRVGCCILQLYVGNSHAGLPHRGAAA